MAKTIRPRASSFFDASAMKRLTVFFGGSSVDLKGREEIQPPPPPPPIPPTGGDTTPTNGIHANGTLTAGMPAAHGSSLSVPSPYTMVIPPRVQSLTPPMDGTMPRAPGAGSLSPHTASPVASAQPPYRNFSGTSALSAASHTSYTSSRPGSPRVNVPVPPSPMAAEMPKQFRKQPQRHGIFGKRRKDDLEIPTAWRLTHVSNENLEGYDSGPLVRGDMVRWTISKSHVIVLASLLITILIGAGSVGA